MRKLTLSLLAVIACVAFACLCSCAPAADEGEQVPEEAKEESVVLQVFADESLGAVVPEIQAAYTAQFPNVTFSEATFGSSGALVERLEGGEEADVLLCASKEMMDEAEKSACVDPATRINLLSGGLSMVAAKDGWVPDGVTMDEVASGWYRIAVGDGSVPAGGYANQALEAVGCWDGSDDAGEAESLGVSEELEAYAGTPIGGMVSVCASADEMVGLVTSGQCDIAFMYSSDILRYDGIRIVGQVPEDSHKRVVYAAAQVQGSEYEDAARDFLTWCAEDPDAAAIWEKWGFSPESE